MNNYLLRVLSIRPFFFLFLSEIFSQIAMNMTNFILIIVAFELTKSNTAVSLIVLSFTVPTIIFGILAGVYVDRWNKKQVLFLTNIIRAFLLLLLAFFFSQNLFFIFILSFLIAIATQFFIPAETPMIPVLVKKNLLMSANSLFGMGIYGSILIAYALSGSIILFFGKTSVFFVLGFLFFIAALFIVLMRVKAANRSSLITKTKEIYHALLLLTLSQVLILVVAVIGPGYAREILGIDIKQFPLLFVTPAALGMVLGAVVLGNFLHAHPKRAMTSAGIFLSGVTLLILPYGSQVTSRGFITALNTYLPAILSINILHIMVFLAFVLGIANALIFVPSHTILQEETSDEVRGKIYGVLNTMVGLFSLFPIILVGGLADLFGVGTVLTGIGAGILALFMFRLLIK
ncbi:MAG: MFS transporter [Candidatus Levybacteria bacterium]|nr:MFS transporter [Candidatus Levybacteria bacterium]